MDLIKFSQISESSIDDRSGIYAWYYRTSLGDKDIKELLELLNKVQTYSEKKEIVNRFLNRHFYQYFKESNYLASIKGKLMPSFQGELEHVDQSSQALVESILEHPSSLWEIKKFISGLSINFSSPIYIGMADSLRYRLNTHKNLIEKLKEEQRYNDSHDERDFNFAYRVVARKMLLKNLFVSISYIESDTKLHNLLENLMNRINYPVLGRN